MHSSERGQQPLTVTAALAELFTEVLRHDAGARLVTTLSWVVTWLVVVDRVGGAILLQLNLAAVHGPQPSQIRVSVSA